MNLREITPLVLTYNEAPNIGRCLDRLRWASQVVVVDSGSSDETASIISTFPNAELHIRPFDNHTNQWNHGLDLVQTDWVLSLDADYILTDAFIAELSSTSVESEVDALLAPFRYCIGGLPLRASLYPPRALLFRRERCRYEADGHTQLLKISGASKLLNVPIHHDDRKPLSRWLWAQDRYAALEADKLLKTDPASMRYQDRLRLCILIAPTATLIYTLLIRGLFRDGWRGWYYTFQRTLAELLLSLHLLERKIGLDVRSK